MELIFILYWILCMVFSISLFCVVAKIDEKLKRPSFCDFILKNDQILLVFLLGSFILLPVFSVFGIFVLLFIFFKKAFTEGFIDNFFQKIANKIVRVIKILGEKDEQKGN